MRSRLAFIVTFIVFAVLTACSEDGQAPTQLRAPATARARSVTPSGTPVTSTIADADAATGAPFQLQSDGAGAYTNSSTLVSSIQSIGDWVLDSYTPRGATRTVYLDFSRGIPGSGPNGGDPIAIPSGLYKFRVISKCDLYGNSFLTIAPGATVACPLHIGDIYVGTQKYAVQMNPNPSASDTAWAETNYANVTCTTSDSGPCTSWTLSPSGIGPDGSPANVAALLAYYTTTSKGKQTTTVVKQGDFWMSFGIGLTNP